MKADWYNVYGKEFWPGMWGSFRMAGPYSSREVAMNNIYVDGDAGFVMFANGTPEDVGKQIKKFAYAAAALSKEERARSWACEI